MRFHDTKTFDNQVIDWEAVYQEQLPHVYNFFRYRIDNFSLAEDLTAVTFEKAWRARNQYRHDLSSFTTWLFTIARNVAIDYRREPHLYPLSEDVLSHELTEEIVEKQADLEHLARLLATLPDRDRELIALKYGANLTNRAIAQATSLSESNVGTILHRAIQHLRRKWEEMP